MHDFKQISVKHSTSIELIVDNKSEFSLIDKGAHGAIFRIADDKCVKIYADKVNCELESKVYKAAQSSPIVPRLYEVGDNYIVMEYIDGESLYNYLSRKKRVSDHIVVKIVFLISEMERLGFTRRDTALRHVIVNSQKELKVVDIVYAYTRNDPNPFKLFTDLKTLGLVSDFMNKLKQINVDLYKRWKDSMKEFYI